MRRRTSPLRPEQGRKPRNGWSGRGLIVAHRPKALLLTIVAAPIPTPIGQGPQFTPARVGPQRPPADGLLRRTGRVPRRALTSSSSHESGRSSSRANIGVARGCRYPLRTLTPTGVIEIGRRGLTVGDFFAVWRMPLSQRRLLTFRGEVNAFVAGKRWRGDVRAIPLTERRQIVLEVGGYVPPHSFYLFPAAVTDARRLHGRRLRSSAGCRTRARTRTGRRSTTAVSASSSVCIPATTTRRRSRFATSRSRISTAARSPDDPERGARARVGSCAHRRAGGRARDRRRRPLRRRHRTHGNGRRVCAAAARPLGRRGGRDRPGSPAEVARVAVAGADRALDVRRLRIAAVVARAAQQDVVARDGEAGFPLDAPERGLELVVGERLDAAALVADEVVMVIVGDARRARSARGRRRGRASARASARRGGRATR